MTLEISLQRPYVLPRAFQAMTGKPGRSFHWAGEGSETDSKTDPVGSGMDEPQGGKRKTGKYRPLTDITLGEVQNVIERFKAQLLLAQTDWIGVNYFCQIPVIQKSEEQSPVIFGRVKTCFPSDGVVDNIKTFEMYFPRKKKGTPDLLRINRNDFSRYGHEQVLAFFIRVRMLISEEERAELEEAGLMLEMNGFYPEFGSSYIDLLEMKKRNRSSHPWLYVIGSRWFASIPDTLQLEVAAKLKEIVGRGGQIFNYHPERLAGEVVPLNRVLEFKHGFTDDVLYEPGDTEEVSFIVSKAFDEMLHIPDK